VTGTTGTVGAVQVSAAGRALFGVTTLVIVTAVVIQLFVAADATDTFFTGTAAALNVFTYFTIQSNLALAASCAFLAIGVAPTATWFRVLRLVGVVGIALTFVVFQLVLRDLQDLTGQAAFCDLMLHTVSPILGVAGWLLVGPRAQTSRPVVVWTTAYVAAYGLFTMVRGAIVRHGDAHFYPYPFMDAATHGYARVIVNLVLVAVVFFALAFGAHALDGWLTRRRMGSTRQ
jgi:hypothetical protein